MRNRTLHVWGCVLQVIACAVAYLFIGRVITYFMMLVYLEPLHGWDTRDYWTGEIVAKPTLLNLPFDYYMWTMGYVIGGFATLFCILLMNGFTTHRRYKAVLSA